MHQSYPLKINQKKVKDVKVLVQKYVPKADHWYYNEILGDIDGEEYLENIENSEEPAYDSDSSFI
ncbi:unnamed protein product [Acanthoscelides obtectus]|uniref:Uncharacterized protein n=1 Tax=Acanthoscelides obtectus TaxID=200917 RepID=A0A9P0MKQ8_ACAOB|nr:unnamed protein product [Acanthoscelides obtectus]CAK1628377.1 hypothetical protein AOBTE_LOCUS5164 [Acanthoscelides obtectus]